MNTLDKIPLSQASDGRWKVGCVLDITAKAESVAVLKAGKNLTYSFTPGGFGYVVTETEVKDPRFTLSSDLSKPGKSSEALDLKYVDSTDPDSAAAILTRGTMGQFVVRKNLDNEVDWAEKQIADWIITFQVGIQKPDIPTESGIDTISQKAYIIAVTRPKVALTA